MTVSADIIDIHVRIGSFSVLKGVDLAVPAGKFLTLLGPSGSGKTTTLNVVGGFLAPVAGHVNFDGQPVDHLSPQQRDLGFVFQDYALFPHMSVGENIAFPLRVRRRDAKAIRAAVADVLELVRLAGMEDRTLASLSGGQRQRVALARALVFKPKVLLLDEPLAALDKQLRENMQGELKRIQSDLGVTTIAVTHDQGEALSMSDLVAVMRDGRVEQVGTPLDLYHRPATAFVAQFLGETNLFAADHAGVVEHFGIRLPAGASTTAVIRPEQFEVFHADPARAGIVRAVVRESLFQGTRYRVMADLAGREPHPVILSMPSTAGGNPPFPGQELYIGFDPATVHSIPGGRP